MMKKGVALTEKHAGYTVIRSGRRTLALTLDRDGRPLVRAPLRVRADVIAAFVESHRAWLARAVERFEWRRSVTELTDEEIRTLREKAERLLPIRVAEYARIMGVTPCGVRITAAKTRFGSCSPKNRLCFSLYLMRYPEKAIDYVVVHELAHIKHKNHGSDFHRAVAAVLPDHLERRRLLSEPPLT